MNRMILIVAVLCLIGCTKDWECCVTTSTVGAPGGDNTFSSCIDYRATNQEKDDFEAIGTSSQESEAGGTIYTINQTTTCVKD